MSFGCLSDKTGAPDVAEDAEIRTGPKESDRHLFASLSVLSEEEDDDETSVALQDCACTWPDSASRWCRHFEAEDMWPDWVKAALCCRTSPRATTRGVTLTPIEDGEFPKYAQEGEASFSGPSTYDNVFYMPPPGPTPTTTTPVVSGVSTSSGDFVRVVVAAPPFGHGQVRNEVVAVRTGSAVWAPESPVPDETRPVHEAALPRVNAEHIDLYALRLQRHPPLTLFHFFGPEIFDLTRELGEVRLQRHNRQIELNLRQSPLWQAAERYNVEVKPREWGGAHNFLRRPPQEQIRRRLAQQHGHPGLYYASANLMPTMICALKDAGGRLKTVTVLHPDGWHDETGSYRQQESSQRSTTLATMGSASQPSFIGAATAGSPATPRGGGATRARSPSPGVAVAALRPRPDAAALGAAIPAAPGAGALLRHRHDAQAARAASPAAGPAFAAAASPSQRPAGGLRVVSPAPSAYSGVASPQGSYVPTPSTGGGETPRGAAPGVATPLWQHAMPGACGAASSTAAPKFTVRPPRQGPQQFLQVTDQRVGSPMAFARSAAESVGQDTPAGVATPERWIPRYWPNTGGPGQALDHGGGAPGHAGW